MNADIRRLVSTMGRLRKPIITTKSIRYGGWVGHQSESHYGKMTESVLEKGGELRIHGDSPATSITERDATPSGSELIGNAFRGWRFAYPRLLSVTPLGSNVTKPCRDGAGAEGLTPSYYR